MTNERRWMITRLTNAEPPPNMIMQVYGPECTEAEVVEAFRLSSLQTALEEARAIIDRVEVTLVAGSCNVPADIYRGGIHVKFFDDDWRDLKATLSGSAPGQSALEETRETIRRLLGVGSARVGGRRVLLVDNLEAREMLQRALSAFGENTDP